jgi:hypothetical protein
MSAFFSQLSCAFAFAAVGSQAFAAEIGLKQDDIATANVSGNIACAAVGKINLKNGAAVKLVLDRKTRQIISGVVEREATSSECESLGRAMLPKPHYRIRLEKGIEDPFDIGILVLKPRFIFRHADRQLIASFGKKEISYRFRQCTSHEGVHSFVFSKDVGIEKPMWHSYYYLAYDTVPTCTKRDVKMMEMFNSYEAPVRQ